MSPAEQAVLQVIQEFNAAFAANDVESYFTYLDQDVVVITPHNPYRIEGWQQDREGFEYYLGIGRAQVHFFQSMQPHIRVMGDSAIVTYYTRGSYGLKGQEYTAYYKETDVLIHTTSGWKIAHIHVSATG